MVQRIKVLAQIELYCPFIPFIRISPNLEDGILRTSSWPVAIAPFRKLRFILWHELLSDCLLHNPVFDRGNPQLAHSSIRLRNLLPSHRRWLVLSASDCFGHSFAVFLEPWKRFFYGHLVHSRRSLVCLYPLVSPVQVVSVQDCFKQVLASACRFFVPRLDGTLRSRIPFAFRAVSLRAASDVFCVLHAVLLPSITPACIGSALPLNFSPKVLWLRLTSARSAQPCNCGYTFRRIPRRPPRVPHVSFPPSTCRIYHMRFRVAIGLRLVEQPYPRI